MVDRAWLRRSVDRLAADVRARSDTAERRGIINILDGVIGLIDDFDLVMGLPGVQEAIDRAVARSVEDLLEGRYGDERGGK